MSYIYILHEKSRNNFKIGSTCDFTKRVSNYITCCDEFNNNTHLIILYEIINCSFNCYQLDDLIQKCSIKINIPFIKHNGSGGREFYKLDDFMKLNTFFDKLNITYKFEYININNIIPSFEWSFNNDSLIINKTISVNEFNSICQLFNEFKLKPYQLEIRNIVSSFDTRLKHMIISPTGTGKTVIFSIIICDFIKKYPNKNIIILSKRKDILYQLKDRLNYYFNKFIDNQLTDTTTNDFNIISCLNNYSNESLNKINNKTNIFIVNWDKQIKDVNWSNFSLMVIDEAHWVGADNIYQFMSSIKSNTELNYLGFSATPVRCNPVNREKTMDIFSDNGNYNILYEYSYYQALKDKSICPIKYYPIYISLADLIDDVDDENNLNNTRTLNKNAYIKVWNQINDNIISKTHFKKGIFWFRNRKEMLSYYINMKDKFHFIPTMSTMFNEDKQMKKLIEKSGLTNKQFENGINEFIKYDCDCILLSVYRAIEGFDDDKLEFGVRMYYSNLCDPLNESQKMGRFNRWFNGDKNEIKQIGYYCSLEINDNIEELRKSLIMRFKSWITFAKQYNKSNGKSIDDKKKEIRELINLYVDADIIAFNEIDIEKDIIDSYEQKEFDKHKIKQALILENKRRTKNNKINTKSLYDEWALLNNYPICDELEEYGFNNFVWLFNMKENDYLNWTELKKLCKSCQENHINKNPAEIYQILIDEGHCIPSISMLNQIYKDYKSIRSLFNINL